VTKTVGIMLAMAMLAGMPASAHSEKSATPSAKAKAAATPRVITLSATEAMKFDPAAIQAKPGEKLHIVLKPTGTMPKMAMAHNFVILKPGSDYAAFANASATAPPTYLAPALKNQVLASTPLASGGETVTADLTAPAKPGSYTFICTFPGHFASGMKGVLVVK
jgi:azurin